MKHSWIIGILCCEYSALVIEKKIISWMKNLKVKEKSILKKIEKK